MEKKQYQDLEKIFKGVANKRRVEVLVLLQKQPEQSLNELAKESRTDYRTLSEHLRKLAIAGLVMKRYQGTSVRHALTKRGQAILKFCRILV